MTNDAPKRIGLIQDGVGNFALATVDEADVAIHYIHFDHAQAEKKAAVAAAYEDCWEIAYAAFEWTDCTQDVAKAIRARADTDALAARDARVKAEALRDLLDLKWTCFHNLETEVDVVSVHDILALIPDQHKVDG